MDMTIEQAMKVAADLEERGCLNEPAKAARVLLAHINSLASPQVTDEQLLAAFNSAPFGLPGLRAVLSLSAPPAADHIGDVTEKVEEAKPVAADGESK